MPDTDHVVETILGLIVAGVAERELLAAIVHLFPDLSPAELWAVLQYATAAAEPRVRNEAF
jgi:hypothetical protein